jgi:hypothetical protein
MAANRMPIDPDAGIPDLVHRLTDDSKRLMTDEVHLAKLEVTDNVKRAGKGSMLLAVSFGIGVVALSFVTLGVATLIGRLAAGHMWVGAVVAAVIELPIGFVLLKRGLHAYAEPSYSLEQTRESLADTSSWAKA